MYATQDINAIEAKMSKMDKTMQNLKKEIICMQEYKDSCNQMLKVPFIQNAIQQSCSQLVGEIQHVLGKYSGIPTGNSQENIKNKCKLEEEEEKGGERGKSRSLSDHNPSNQEAFDKLYSCISNIDTKMNDTIESNKQIRKRLQDIESNLIESQNKISKLESSDDDTTVILKKIMTQIDKLNHNPPTVHPQIQMEIEEIISSGPSKPVVKYQPTPEEEEIDEELSVGEELGEHEPTPDEEEVEYVEEEEEATKEEEGAAEEEEEAGYEPVEINGETYYTDDQTSGKIYSLLENDELSTEPVGEYVNGVPKLYSQEEEEEEEPEYFAVKVAGKTYYTNNETSGLIHILQANEELSDPVGQYVNGVAKMFKPVIIRK